EGNSYAMTLLFQRKSKAMFEHNMSIRAFVQLKDGTIEYSDIESFSMLAVAKYLYDNCMMPTYYAHTFVYDNIITVCDAEYANKEYDFINILAKGKKVK
ncbi:MAG: hypothetical protein IKN54_04195, partial [Lachnospiraceae bacterium]|nr:hypothetical protein [Lachnospiraceae bacterium]